MRTPPLLADFIHPRNCKPICENSLTLPFEKAVQEIPSDKTVWYELPAQAVEIKTAVVGFCSYSGCFYL